MGGAFDGTIYKLLLRREKEIEWCVPNLILTRNLCFPLTMLL